MSDLLRASGLGKGSLYGAFGDKHALFLRVLRKYGEDKMGALRERLEATRSGAQVLRDFVLEPAADTTGAASRRGCLLANSSAELASVDPDVASQAQQIYSSMTAVLTSAAERAQIAGEITQDVDPESVAQATLAAQLGVVALGRAGMSPALLSATAHSAIDRILSPAPVR